MNYQKHLNDAVKLTNAANTIRVIGDISSRNAMNETINLIWYIDDYVGIKKNIETIE